MGLVEIQQRLLDEYGLRVTPAMGEYILSQVRAAKTTEVPIIAGDARTGIPLRKMIPIADLQRFATETPLPTQP